jgi:hypothetical protein
MMFGLKKQLFLTLVHNSKQQYEQLLASGPDSTGAADTGAHDGGQEEDKIWFGSTLRCQK